MTARCVWNSRWHAWILAVAVSAGVPTGGLAQSTLGPRIDTVFAKWATTRTPGCAVALSQHGRTLYERGYGVANLELGAPITVDTVFESGSVAKQFTAGAVALLVVDGSLSLDDPVRRYVPELPDFGAPILIRHLLTHTSGLRSQWPLLTLSGRPPGLAVHTVEEILELVGRQRELNFPPGTDWLYNNTAFTLATVVVERVAGMPFAVFCHQRLFRPLGMSKTQWRDDFTRIIPGRATGYRALPDGTFRVNQSITNVIGNGGLLTTVGDLMKWNANLDQPRVGGEAWARLLQTVAVLNDGTRTRYGLGLFIDAYRGVREVSHGGATAGYQTFVARYPDAHVAVVVLCNTTGTDPAAYAHAVADTLLEARAKPVRAIVARDVDRAVLQRLDGIYRDRTTDALTRLFWDDTRRVFRGGGGDFVPTAGGTLQSMDGSTSLTVTEPVAGAWPAAAEGIVLTERDDAAVRPIAWHKETPVAPTSEELAAFPGRYWSPELDVVYGVVLEQGQLEVRFRPAQRIRLMPAFHDGFFGDGYTFRFSRHANGDVDELFVSTGRVRRLRFLRQR